MVGETYDGALNDINGMHVRPEHLFAAIEPASGGPVAEGNVGGGTGMICHDFKGGTGTASRVVGAEGGWTVGALVQANHGDRERLTVDGVHVGESDPDERAPVGLGRRGASRLAGRGLDHRRSSRRMRRSLPHQLDRLAQRAGLGIARVGGGGGNSSGDIFLAFSTANAGRMTSSRTDDGRRARSASTCSRSARSPPVLGRDRGHRGSDPERARGGRDMVGRDGITAHALPHDRLVEIMTKHGRGPNP